MTTRSITIPLPSALFVAGLAVFGFAALLIAGPLNPPAGPITSTGKTLTEVEPRIPINATNTPGDADSLYKISQPGSYYLTSNITGVAGKHGIEIAASGVTLDLNGFSLVGVPGMGAFDGISVSQFFLNSIAVLNGTVREWGDDGVDLGFLSFGSRVEGVRAMSNAGLGILVGERGTIADCSALFNAGEGLRAAEGSIITSCISNSNGGPGFQIDEGGTISACAATLNAGPGVLAAARCSVLDTICHDNASDGIQIGNASAMSRCNVFNNVGAGIEAQQGCTISQCAASENGDNGICASAGAAVLGCSASYNDGNGIAVFAQSTVTDCTAIRNGGTGISASSESTVTDCTSDQNDGNGFAVNLGAIISGCTARSNALDGITAARSLVVGNYCHGNGIAGIHVTSGDSRIEGNSCVENQQGIDVDLAGSIIIRNTCSGNAINWSVVAGNVCLVVNAATSAAINGNSGGVSPGSTDPNANFTY